MQGTYVELDGRPALRFERRLAHPVDAVWRAVTEPEELAQWFPAAVEVEPRPGGAMAFHFPGGEAPDSAGEVLEHDPPRVFAFRWNDDELRFELEADGGDGCVLRFTHILDARDRAARDAAGWHVCLDQLERRLAGAGDGPATGPTEDWRGLYEDYVARGLPSGAEIPGQA
jgi:uncharacterized protein YndB with AHSA1/START domain